MLETITWILSFIIAAFSVIVIAPKFISRMKLEGLTGKDMNKFNKPQVAELGGAVVFLGFTFGVFASIFVATYLNWINIELSFLLGGFCTIAVIAFVGVIDDIIGWKKGIRQWQHALFPIIAALPLMAINAGHTTMMLPLFGVINFGIIYPLVIIPIAVTGASNAFNMLAGFNGLEAGQGIILTGTLTIIAILSGQGTAAVLGVAMVAALISFLKFNWFPAKIFGGDSLTLMIGANLAVMSILGNMETLGVIVMGLFIIEFLIKARHKFQSECFGVPTKDGKLKANSKGGSITQWILGFGKGKLNEAQVTVIILGFQIAVCMLAVFYAIIKGVIL